MKPFGIISDSHNHNFDAFATVDKNGINSRLKSVLDETMRAAAEVYARGGRALIHAGDLFHVRGKLAPSVLNPTMDVYRAIIKMGMRVILLPGNHDLENRDAARVSSAVTALEGIGCEVIHDATVMGIDSQLFYFVPWQSTVAETKAKLEFLTAGERPAHIAIIHAPIDGVIVGIPDHGLDPAYLAGLGYKGIYSGHYHNHKEVAPGVFSIGALTHQTWSDIGAKAGFLIVSSPHSMPVTLNTEWHASHAPSFIAIDGDTDPEEIPLLVDGNYVRIKIASSASADIEACRAELLDAGAKGVTIISEKAATGVARTASTVKAGASVEESLNEYVKAASFGDLEVPIGAEVQRILLEVRSAS